MVTGGQAYKWWTVRIHGRDSHAGTTPMDMRADPLLLAARLMVSANATAIKHGGCATTGILSLQPGSINTIPNLVEYSLDMRHHDNMVLAGMEEDVRAAAESMVAESHSYSCTVDMNEIFHSPATRFHPDCIAAVRSAAEAAVGAKQMRDIVSGAGHDSCSTAKVCPSAMVFVPSRDGLSHNPLEYTSPEDCGIGAQVLMDAALVYDAGRAV